MTADRAAEIGLITKAVSPRELLNEANRMARKLATRPKQGVKAVKRAVHHGGSLPLKKGLNIEHGELLSSLGAPEAIALMDAYVKHTDRTGALPAHDPEAR